MGSVCARDEAFPKHPIATDPAGLLERKETRGVLVHVRHSYYLSQGLSCERR